MASGIQLKWLKQLPGFSCNVRTKSTDVKEHYNKEHDITGRAGRAASDASSSAAGAASKAWGSIWGKK